VDQVRLFRNHPRLRWRYRVHEQILPAVLALGQEVRRSNVVVQHTGYQDQALRVRKLLRDLRLLELEYREQPGDPFTLFNLGQVLRELGRVEEALACLRRSLARTAPAAAIVPKLHTLIAQCLQRLGRLDDALAACQQGLLARPGDVELLFHQGLALRALGDSAGAAACWERCLGLPPGEGFASFNPGLRGHLTRHQLAQAFRDLGRPADAEAQWRAALRERPDHKPAWRGLAELLHAQARWVEAKELAQAAAEPLGPQYVACLRARTLLARKNYAEARRRLTDAVARWPQATEPRVLLSYALLQEGKDPDAAAQALRDLLGVDPDNDEARRNLEVLLHKQGRFANGAVPPELTLADLYRHACQRAGGTAGHLPALYLLARRCPAVTVLGDPGDGAVTALLFAGPATVTVSCAVRPPVVDLVAPLAGPTRFTFREACEPAAEETDLLVAAGWRAYDQLRTALARHAGRVRRFVVLCGVAGFGGPSGAGGYRGPWPAVEEFLAQDAFRLRERLGGDGGLTVLERVAPEGTTQVSS
jgi:tetratricopeptide (TPR) repeat protein